MSARDAYKRARRSDPATSKAAAARANMVGSQAAVIACVRQTGRVTREELEHLLSARWSPSRVRTAVTELMDQRRIARVDETTNSRDRRVEVLALTWPDGDGAVCASCGDHGDIHVTHDVCRACGLVLCLACMDLHHCEGGAA